MNNKAKHANIHVKIRCPKCKGSAELEADFSLVKCHDCDFEMTYGEYVKYVAHNDVTYSDILGDYTGTTAGQKSGTLDEWD
jgi:ribosomal protein L37AE/L43A